MEVYESKTISLTRYVVFFSCYLQDTALLNIRTSIFLFQSSILTISSPSVPDPFKYSCQLPPHTHSFHYATLSSTPQVQSSTPIRVTVSN